MNVVNDDTDTHSLQQDQPNIQYYYKSGRREGRKNKSSNKGLFREDLKTLMYGFGDNKYPNETSVDLLEDYVQEFIVNLVVRTAKRSQRNCSNTLKLADVLRVLQKDEKKFLRMPYILLAQKEIKGVNSYYNKTTEHLLPE